MSSPAADVTRLEEAAARWRVALDSPPARSPSGCIAFGRRADGEPVVVKVAGARSDEREAWAALAHWAGQGSVRLLAHDPDAVLLERARPGTELAALVGGGRDDEATAVLCDVAARLHAPDASPPLLARFPTVGEWGRGFERYNRSGARVLPADLVCHAAATFEELTRSQDAPHLLHGDLHHHNILHDAVRGWLAIDPKGVVGERAYEFGALLRNPHGFDAARASVVERRCDIIAERSGVGRDRLLAWGFAQAVLSAVWSWEDGEPADHALALARAMREAR
jgi:streptomycin 6-kinase